MIYHPQQLIDGWLHAGYCGDQKDNWLCDADQSDGRPVRPCDGDEDRYWATYAKYGVKRPTVYHPWLKKKNGEYSGPYYSDRKGHWLCDANEKGEPILQLGQLSWDGSGSHDHTLPPHKFSDGTVVGGAIGPSDPVHVQ
jgi:hypothetical protein